MAERNDSDVRVTLDLGRGAEPIQGRAAGPGGFAREFFGWLELTSILEQIRAPFRAADHDGGPFADHGVSPPDDVAAPHDQT
jgi:hypothetical protein